MSEVINFSELGFTDEIDFLRSYSDLQTLENTINERLKNLNVADFSSQDDYLKRYDDLQMLTSRYQDLFWGKEEGAEYHWFFLDGLKAFQNGAILASLTSFICGIEASLRSTLYLMDVDPQDNLYFSEIMNKKTLKLALEKGLPIESLAFKDENDFLKKVTIGDPTNLMLLRNDLMHGNIYKYSELVNGERTFFPTNMFEVTTEIMMISKNWIRELVKFKNEALI